MGCVWEPSGKGGKSISSLRGLHDPQLVLAKIYQNRLVRKYFFVVTVYFGFVFPEI